MVAASRNERWSSYWVLLGRGVIEQDFVRLFDSRSLLCEMAKRSSARDEMRIEMAMRIIAVLIATTFSSTGLKPRILLIFSPMVEKNW